MVAIGLLVNWSVLNVCGSKCGPIFVVCGGREGEYLCRYTCLLPCGLEVQALS